jgi:hypothetical protein
MNLRTYLIRDIVKYHDMNYVTSIERIDEAREVLEKLLDLTSIGAC